MTETENKETTKKPYRSPEFTTYGDIRTITQTNDNSGNPDGQTRETDKHLSEKMTLRW